MLVLAMGFFQVSFLFYCLVIYLSCLFYLYIPAKEMDLDKEDICNTVTYRKIYFV